MEEALAGPDGGPRVPATTRRRTSVLGVIGEILITAGVIVLLYVVWQLYIGDMIYGAERNGQGQELSQEWAGASPSTNEPGAAPVTAEPIVREEPADGERFGVMHVPRFGADYAMPMAGGVTRERTLNPIGIGHYPGTQMPGDVGNFAVAAHRTSWGEPFRKIADLQVGDPIVVETEDGWYTYRFRTLQYVQPTQRDVLLPVPQAPDVPAGTRYITLTSCSPIHWMWERIIAYGVFESFTPRSAGPPASLDEGIA
ncbi:class E sortase [Microbacterium sp.]|uniref:class E sortase n=1 Tax=Microbacterium sp. TaxID=51671 RepID=UPI0035AE82C0